MSADIWMPLYIGDYLADTRRLNTEQHGCYLLLIMDYWKNGPPPDDDETLCRITACTLTDWKRLRRVMEVFFQIEDGVWNHRRIDRERDRAKANSETYQARARAAAEKRWNTNKHASSNASSTRQALLERCPPSPSPSPSLQSEPAPAPKPDGNGASAPRFSAPDLAQVKLEGAKCGLPESECSKFFNFYSSKGWMVGKTRMRSMPHALAGWRTRWQESERNRRNGAPVTGTTGSTIENTVMRESCAAALRTAKHL